jgi:hypothetical protein
MTFRTRIAVPPLTALGSGMLILPLMLRAQSPRESAANPPIHGEPVA